ncbi:MAG: PEP-CTERM sorting domain-containing protein [Trichodesmium sp. St15_bin1_1]|jgi:hypothetical protein|nr:PEP-CTERM sorting domain-containing protein [Trichodesmium sp. St16_bin2-tuft]MDE5113091.1 PEP-CTERM sorting domain-containing protein [Trichodesmium sp. St15_bin1_1]MDE5118367.1 PEP-CTERM sorting domain-containing protein [Trichodesmium sp. St2_bin2_1]
MNKRVFFTSVGLVLCAETLFFSQSVSAAFIQPDTATASSEYSSNFLAEYTIDGSGLPVGFDQNDLHGPYTFGNNHWTSASGTTPTDQFIEWGFDNPQTLGTIYIWNHQSTKPPANNRGYDVTLFDLTLFDESDNVLLSLNDVSLLPDSNEAQALLFGSVISNVSTVLFEIEAVQSSPNYTGLAEVGFDTTAVPEPSSILGVSIFLFGTGFKRKLAKTKKK